MDAFGQAKLRHPAGQWLDVRYEDLLAAPREQVGRMLDFLGRRPAGLRRYTRTPGREHCFPGNALVPSLFQTVRGFSGLVVGLAVPVRLQHGE
ncbi:sulfotransferase [Plantactinospora sp. DSM 117369]